MLGQTTTYQLPAPPGRWIVGSKCAVYREDCPWLGVAPGRYQEESCLQTLAQCQAAKELCDDYVRSHYGAHAGTPEGNACHECEREAEALKQLLELREASLRASSASAGTAASQEVLDRLYTLPWLPFEIHRVEECAGVKLNRMHPAVRARLPDALLLAAYALRDRIKAEAGASSENRTKLAALAQYAGAVGGRAQLPGHVLKTVSEVLSMFQG